MKAVSAGTAPPHRRPAAWPGGLPHSVPRGPHVGHFQGWRSRYRQEEDGFRSLGQSLVPPHTPPFPHLAGGRKSGQRASLSPRGPVTSCPGDGPQSTGVSLVRHKNTPGNGAGSTFPEELGRDPRNGVRREKRGLRRWGSFGGQTVGWTAFRVPGWPRTLPPPPRRRHLPLAFLNSGLHPCSPPNCSRVAKPG